METEKPKNKKFPEPKSKEEILNMPKKERQIYRFQNPIPVTPYKVGDKIKIYLSTSDSVFLCTFGQVISVDVKNVPTVVYRDYSTLQVSDFNRCTTFREVEKKGKFVEHSIKFNYGEV